MDSENGPSDTCIANLPVKYQFLSQFEDLDMDSLSPDNLESNREEITMEVEALESILMDDFKLFSEHPKTLPLPSNPSIELEISSGVLLTVYPEESVSTQLTKIVSSTSSNPSDPTEGVKIRRSKVDYLPSFDLIVLFPVTYPTLTPPIFGLLHTKPYPTWEDIVNKEFGEIYEGGQCVYEWYAFLQDGFVQQYIQDKNESLKCVATSNEEYEELQKRSRDTFKHKFRKEQKTCVICFDNYYGNSFYVLSGCGHYFCMNCVGLYCQNLIRDANINNLRCPDSTCSKYISEEDLEQIVNKEYFEKYKEFKLNNQVDLAEDQTWCPNPECGAVAKVIGGNMFGECDECWFRFCLTCKNYYHSGKRCPVLNLGTDAFNRMSKEEQDKFIQDQLADKYLKKYSKDCPSCKVSITKLTGCNKMT